MRRSESCRWLQSPSNVCSVRHDRALHSQTIFSRDHSCESLPLRYTPTTPTGGTSRTVVAALAVTCNPSCHKERLGLLVPWLRPPGHLRLSFSCPGTSNGERIISHKSTVTITMLRLCLIRTSKPPACALLLHVPTLMPRLSCMMLTHADDPS